MNKYKVVEGARRRTLRRQAARRFESRRAILNCVTVAVDFDNSCKVADPSFTGCIWVREYGQDSAEFGGVFRVFNGAGVKDMVNLPVFVGPSPRDPRQLQVLGYNAAVMRVDPSFTNLPYGIREHGSTHTFIPGRPNTNYSTDVAFITERNLMSGLVLPTDPPSMQCRVTSLARGYRYDRTVKRFEGGYTGDLSAHVPAAGLARLLFVLLNGSTNALQLLDGPTFGWTGYSDPLPPAALVITVPEGCAILSAVLLYNGMTAIAEREFLYEVRPLFGTLGVTQSLAELSDVGDGTPTAGYLLVGDGDSWESVDPGTLDVAVWGSGGAGFGDVLTADGYGGSSWQPPTGGAGAFIDLTDVPADYTGHAGEAVLVNATEDGLRFSAGYWEPLTSEWGDLILDENNELVMHWVEA